MFDFGSILEPSWRLNGSQNPEKNESKIRLNLRSDKVGKKACYGLGGGWPSGLRGARHPCLVLAILVSFLVYLVF